MLCPQTVERYYSRQNVQERTPARKLLETANPNRYILANCISSLLYHNTLLAPGFFFSIVSSLRSLSDSVKFLPPESPRVTDSVKSSSFCANPSGLASVYSASSNPRITTRVTTVSRYMFSYA